MERVLPILFNTDMVLAILDERKTVTRRIVKHDVDAILNSPYHKEHPEVEDKQIISKLCMPPYHPGDILYVRESVFQGVWHYLDVSGETVSVLTHDFEYYADGLHEKDHWKDKYERTWMHRRPSIHMPKEASRIWLKVKNVRVERLQDITEEQALSEGVPDDLDYPISKVYCPRCRGEGLIGSVGENLGYMEVDCPDCDTAIKRFKNLWNSTIKKSDIDSYGLDVNPWVWVIEFERCEKPENE